MAWLHGRTEGAARGAVIYLLPGLAGGQRRAVIRRLRQEASRGFGPPLPLPLLALALGLDRLRTAAGLAGAIVRLHPTVALLPSGLAAAVMTLFVVSAGGSGISGGLPGGLAAPALSRPAAWYVCARPPAGQGGQARSAGRAARSPEGSQPRRVCSSSAP